MFKSESEAFAHSCKVFLSLLMIFSRMQQYFIVSCSCDHRDQLEVQDPAEREGTLDPLVHLVNKVYLELLEKRVER